MSDYSDYGVHPELEALTAEHDEMRRLCSELLAAGRAEPMASTTVTDRLDQLGVLLDRHTTREEAGLFATLHRVAIDGGYVGRFQHDHRDLVAALDEARTDHGLVPALVERLEAHLTVEENDTFHGAHQLLSAEDWAEIDQAVAAV